LYFSFEEWYLPVFTSEIEWLVNRIPRFERSLHLLQRRDGIGTQTAVLAAVPLAEKTPGEVGLPCVGFPADRRGNQVKRDGGEEFPGGIILAGSFFP